MGPFGGVGAAWVKRDEGQVHLGEGRGKGDDGCGIGQAQDDFEGQERIHGGHEQQAAQQAQQQSAQEAAADPG